VIAIPPDPVPTHEARAALPSTVPITDAVYNVAHASLLVLGLAKDDFSLIGAGLSDRSTRTVEPHLYPRSMELVAQAKPWRSGSNDLGAGPTVLFWCHWQGTGGVSKHSKPKQPTAT